MNEEITLGYLIDPFEQFQDTNGLPIVSGIVEVYDEDTENLATIYKDFNQTLQTNPCYLDTLGNVTVIADGTKFYNIIVKDSEGNILLSKNHIKVSNSITETEIINQRAVVLPGDGINVVTTELGNTTNYTVSIDPDYSISNISGADGIEVSADGNNYTVYPTSALFNKVNAEYGLYKSVEDLGDNNYRINIGLNHFGDCRMDGTGIAVGKDTTANNISFAQGDHSIATGWHSHAEGSNTSAYGNCSHTIGSNTIAYGTNSLAGGFNTIASGADQTVFGKYNIPNETDLFQIGAGTPGNSNKNALTVDNSGDVTIYDNDLSGNISVSSYLKPKTYFTIHNEPDSNVDIRQTWTAVWGGSDVHYGVVTAGNILFEETGYYDVLSNISIKGGEVWGSNPQIQHFNWSATTAIPPQSIVAEGYNATYVTAFTNYTHRNTIYIPTTGVYTLYQPIMTNNWHLPTAPAQYPWMVNITVSRG